MLEPAKAHKLVGRISALSIISNLALTAFKLLAGILGHSSAMVSDAVHSLSDVCGTLIALIGIRQGEKASDADHQYGHERLECVASILLALILFVTGGGIGLSALSAIRGGGGQALAAPGVIALAAAVVSIAVKEALFWVTRRAAIQVGSDALRAEAWHHRSDALSSIGSFIGIFGARLGLPILDPIAGLAICLVILKVAFDIFRRAVSQLTDRSCDEATVAAMTALITAQPGVLGLDDLKTRCFGSKIYVDVEISAQASQTLESAHTIAEGVHHAIEAAFPAVKHCMVHVNPREP